MRIKKDPRSRRSRRTDFPAADLCAAWESAAARWGPAFWNKRRPRRNRGQFVGPGAVPVTLKINGKPVNLNVEPRVTLLDALRNNMDLTGAKRVCDRGTCGACTVIMNGKVVYSCTVLAIDAQGKEIQTIEGIAPAQPASGLDGVRRHTTRSSAATARRAS